MVGPVTSYPRSVATVRSDEREDRGTWAAAQVAGHHGRRVVHHRDQAVHGVRDESRVIELTNLSASRRSKMKPIGLPTSNASSLTSIPRRSQASKVGGTERIVGGADGVRPAPFKISNPTFLGPCNRRRS